jgi:hypothetical protein
MGLETADKANDGQYEGYHYQSGVVIIMHLLDTEIYNTSIVQAQV